MVSTQSTWGVLKMKLSYPLLFLLLSLVCLISSSPTDSQPPSDYEYDIGPRAQSVAANAGGPRGKDGACPEIGETVPGRGAAANALADFSLRSRQACSTTINRYLDLLLIVYL